MTMMQAAIDMVKQRDITLVQLTHAVNQGRQRLIKTAETALQNQTRDLLESLTQINPTDADIAATRF